MRILILLLSVSFLAGCSSKPVIQDRLVTIKCYESVLYKEVPTRVIVVHKAFADDYHEYINDLRKAIEFYEMQVIKSNAVNKANAKKLENFGKD